MKRNRHNYILEHRNLKSATDGHRKNTEKTEIAKPPARNFPAYKWFVKGKMYFYEKFQTDKAIEYFGKSLDIYKKLGDDKNISDAKLLVKQLQDELEK